jgi:hypothetical protein
VAAATFVIIQQGAAVTARSTAPEGEFHERALGVVMSQHACHDHKEVEQAAFQKRPTNAVSALPFAQRVVHDMRVCDVLAAFGRMRILSDHTIGRRIVR